jgi:predicted phage terminase large subunit-like protein
MPNLTDSLIKHDFPSFLRECHRICRGEPLDNDPYLLPVCALAEDIANGTTRRAIVNLPPGTAKSFIFAVVLPAWTLAHDPSASIMLVQHSKKLARDSTRLIRKIMESESFRRISTTRIDPNWSGAGDFGTTKGGSVFATSIGGTITGYRADLTIVDDPLAIKEANNIAEIEFVNATFDDEIASRTRGKRSRIVIVMHRLHPDDLTGHLRDKGYKQLAIPLVFNKPKTYSCRYGVWKPAKGEQIRRGRYSRRELRDFAYRPSFRWLYQQGNGSGASLRVKPKHFKLFDRPVDRSLPFVFSIDTAQKGNADSSRMAIQVWQTDGFNHYLVHAFGARCEYTRVWEELRHLVGRYPPAMILIEDTSVGSALIDQAQQRLQFKVRGVIPRGDKFERLRRHFRTIARGRIHLPVSADWVPDWVDEIVACPDGRYTDQVDALSMYLDFMATHPHLASPSKPGALGVLCGARGQSTVVMPGRGPRIPAVGVLVRATSVCQPTFGRTTTTSRQIETPLGPVILHRRH